MRDAKGSDQNLNIRIFQKTETAHKLISRDLTLKPPQVLTVKEIQGAVRDCPADEEWISQPRVALSQDENTTWRYQLSQATSPHCLRAEQQGGLGSGRQNKIHHIISKNMDVPTIHTCYMAIVLTN